MTHLVGTPVTRALNSSLKLMEASHKVHSISILSSSVGELAKFRNSLVQFRISLVLKPIVDRTGNK